MTAFQNISTRRKALYADGAILLAAVLWGGDYIFAKRALEVISPGYMNAIRFGVCALIMLAAFFPRIRHIKRGEAFWGILTGIMMFGGFVGQTTGLMHTSVGNNAFITSSYVVMVPFLAWGLTRKKPGSNNFIAVFLCLAGIGLLSLQGGMHLGRGDLITLMGAVFFGFELALLGIYAKKIDPLVLGFIEAATAAVLFIAYGLLFEQPPVQWDRPLVLSMIYLTFFGSVLTHIIVTVALKYTSSSHGAVLCSTESVFGVLLSIIFLGEVLNIRGWLGCALVLAAVLMAELGGKLLKSRETVNGRI